MCMNDALMTILAHGRYHKGNGNQVSLTPGPASGCGTNTSFKKGGGGVFLESVRERKRVKMGKSKEMKTDC